MKLYRLVAVMTLACISVMNFLLVPSEAIAENFTMTEDTYVQRGSPDEVFGTGKSILVKDSTDDPYDRISYMKINYTNYIESSIGQAKLNFYVSKITSSTATGKTYKLYGMTDDQWSESTVCWNKQPSTNGATLVGSIFIPATGWFSIDVSTFINSQMSDKIASFQLIEETNGGDLLEIASSNATANTPYLSMINPSTKSFWTVLEAPQIVYKDEGGKETNQLKGNGYVKITTKVKNESGKADLIELWLIAALYNADGVIQRSITDKKAVGGNQETDLSVEMTALPNNVSSGYLKIFLWDSLQGMRPIDSFYQFRPTDTYIRSGSNADTNYAEDSQLYVGRRTNKDCVSYFQIDFQRFTAQTVSSANLNFFVNTVSSDTRTGKSYQLLAIHNQWTPSGISWNNRPIVTETENLGYIFIQNIGWHKIDLTGYMQRHLADSKVSFMLVEETEGSDLVQIASSNANFNQPFLSISGGNPQVGPFTVPFTRFEAESGITNGQILANTTQGQMPTEASGRSCVMLGGVGQYVEVKSTVSANRLFVRYSFPVDETGTTSGTLSLYINGVHRRDLLLDNFRSIEPKSDISGGYARFYDEINVPEEIQINDLIRLQKDSQDLLPIYYIDYVEVETAPPQLDKPDATWLSITESPFNANGADTNDDTTAIKNCISAAAAQNKRVWIPQGDFYIKDTIELPAGVEMNGAGMWYAVIHKKFGAKSAKKGILLNDSNAVRNLKLQEEDGFYRGLSNQGIRFGSNCLIEGVWVENISGSGIAGYNAQNVKIRRCRVRGTYQDAIHFARDAVNCLVEDNMVRNAGDDGVAFIAYENTNQRNNIARRNLIELNYWGRGMTIQGGRFNTFDMNLVRDSSYCSGILAVAETFNEESNLFCKDFLIQNNEIQRCGNSATPQFGALWVYAQLDVPFSGDIQFNRIRNEVRNGIYVLRYVPSEVSIRYNTIDPPGAGGRHIYTNLAADHAPIIENNLLQ